ncbi:hypothetical protein [Thermococcus peptonophilus]|uniref:hypothetical protein n=1 Tax=Thermococcus peptonophilus TaxID=53952 RepID=UPI000B11477A
MKEGKPKGISEVSWVDESVVLRRPALYIPSYYRAVEVTGEKLLSSVSTGQGVKAYRL